MNPEQEAENMGELVVPGKSAVRETMVARLKEDLDYWLTTNARVFLASHVYDDLRIECEVKQRQAGGYF